MRRIVVGLVLGACTVTGCGGNRKAWSDARKDREAAEVPKVPYLVQAGSPMVNLWSDKGRTEPKARHHVPAGTKCQILESEDVDKSRGKTMYRVRVPTGEEGWVPSMCIEYRKK